MSFRDVRGRDFGLSVLSRSGGAPVAMSLVSCRGAFRRVQSSGLRRRSMKIPAPRSRVPPRPKAGNCSGRPSAPLIAAASADASPGGTSQPLTPGLTLSVSPPAVVATTARRWAIASSVTSELPSYNVGCTKRSAASYHACSSRSGRRPVSTTRSRSPALVIAVSSAPRKGPSPTTTQCHRPSPIFPA